DGGREVWFAGEMTTPMHYWFNRAWGAGGSVQVTASHNPGRYNGMKVSGPAAKPVGYDSGLAQIESEVAALAQSLGQAHVLEELPLIPPPSRAGAEIVADYCRALRAEVNGAIQGFGAIAVDTGNGMG